jgi:hypothetical protein
MTGYFAELEQELLAAAERQRNEARSPQPASTSRRFGARRLRVMTVALALVVVAGVPAAAVTGVFRPHREPDGLVRLAERRVIAEGTTPDRGHWQLLASQSDVGFCFGIRMPTGIPGDDGTTVSEGCGVAQPGSLKVATASGGSLRQNGLAFGMAPDQAARARVEGRGVTVTVETLDDNVGLDGRFYVAELPVRTSLGPTIVIALDNDGAVIGKTSLGCPPEAPHQGQKARYPLQAKQPEQDPS